MKNGNITRILPVRRRLLFNLAVMMLLLASSCRKDVEVDPVPANRSLEVWLHRVNTTGKAQHFQFIYSGFELDVHYDTSVKTFFVKHNFSDSSTLTLSAWLTAIFRPERLGYWLDFKNLTPANKSGALAELLRIRSTFGLTLHPIVVESDNPPALAPFDTLNFRISYYIPYFDPAYITPEQEQTYRENIHGSVTANNIGTMSGYSIQHVFMQQWFPEMNKLLWYLDSYDQDQKDSVINLTRRDPTVEVMLVAEYY